MRQIRSITTDHARQWGVKAAQSGLSISENPYGTGASRSAWEQGYRQIALAPVEQLERAYWTKSKGLDRVHCPVEPSGRQIFKVRPEVELDQILCRLRELCTEAGHLSYST
jgi:ribosome modulation factor